MVDLSSFIAIVAEELSVPVESIGANTDFRNISSWSSLNALLLISRLNAEYEVLLSSADLASAKTLSDIYSLIKSSDQ